MGIDFRLFYKNLFMKNYNCFLIKVYNCLNQQQTIILPLRKIFDKLQTINNIRLTFSFISCEKATH